MFLSQNEIKTLRKDIFDNFMLKYGKYFYALSLNMGDYIFIFQKEKTLQKDTSYTFLIQLLIYNHSTQYGFHFNTLSQKQTNKKKGHVHNFI